MCVCRCECVCVSVALLFLLSSNHFECVGTPVAGAAVAAPSDVVVVAFVVVITQEIALHLMTAIFISFASFRLGFSQQSKREIGPKRKREIANLPKLCCQRALASLPKAPTHTRTLTHIDPPSHTHTHTYSLPHTYMRMPNDVCLVNYAP